MALKIAFIKNNLNKDASLVPFVVEQATVSYESLLKEMSKDTALSQEDMRATMANFAQSLKKFMAEGRQVETEIGTFFLTAKGKLKDSNESVRPSAASTDHGFSPNLRWNGKYKESMLSKVRHQRLNYHGPKIPFIRTVQNLTNPEMDYFSADCVLDAKGQFLKISRKAEKDEGIFLQGKNGVEYKIEKVLSNTKSGFLIHLKGLPPGEYSLQVRSRGKNKALLLGRFDTPITIIP